MLMRGRRRVLCVLTGVSLFMTIVLVFLLHNNSSINDNRRRHATSDGFPDYDDFDSRVTRHLAIKPRMLPKPRASTSNRPNLTEPEVQAEPEPQPKILSKERPNVFKPDLGIEKVAKGVDEKNSSDVKEASVDSKSVLNYNLHAFYYPWYGNPEFDNGTYLHWNHQYLPHWDKNVAQKYPKGEHRPPLDIGSDYYPVLGPYSSSDESVITQHMKWLVIAKIGVIAVSWFPPGIADKQGRPWDDLILKIMHIAHKFDIKVTFHIEPYTNRTIDAIRESVQFIVKKYGSHNAMYYYQHQGVKKLLLYIYDSYLINSDQWSRLLSPSGNLTVRGTELDAYFIGLIVQEKDRMAIVKAGFDGIYTYFASDGFTYGSSTKFWSSLRVYAKKNKLIFIPSVGPGYTDVRVRPWNSGSTKSRDGGLYYTSKFIDAINAQADLISVTSFNEWHEGTQIEPCASGKMSPDGFTYLDYSPNSPMFYLQLTANYSTQFARKLQDLYGAKEQQLLIAAAGV